MMESQDGDFAFRCPQCHEDLTVNGAMRQALIEKGCVICSGVVTAEDFSPEPSVES